MKIAQNNQGMRKSVPLGLYGFKSNKTHQNKCSYCNSYFARVCNEVKYIIDEEIFCSIKCKSMYLEEHFEVKLKHMTKVQIIEYIKNNDYTINIKRLFNHSKESLVNKALEIHKKLSKRGIK